MDEVLPFSNKTKKPGGKALKEALGKAHPLYMELMDLCGDFKMEWKFYKSSGWILKVFDRKKALFWLVPLKNKVRISFALREEERKAVRKMKIVAHWLEDLKAAKKYPEGYAFRIEVGTKKASKEACRIVREVMSRR
ncbi:MAG: DUF3788 family protein [Planctomycetota bacterium]|jgi:hypothetical protein